MLQRLEFKIKFVEFYVSRIIEDECFNGALIQLIQVLCNFDHIFFDLIDHFPCSVIVLIDDPDGDFPIILNLILYILLKHLKTFNIIFHIVRSLQSRLIETKDLRIWLLRVMLLEMDGFALETKRKGALF